jgi:hypothetical protein
MMMKNILLAFVCLLFVKTACAQKDSLAFDEHDKYIYYQTGSKPGLSADSLYNRGLYFIKTAYPKSKLTMVTADKSEGVITGKGSFLVSKKAFITTHEDGAISFSLRMEVKDSKYRYWFTDFVYTPYQRNRYNVYEPVPGVTIPMEHAQGKIDKDDFAVYLDKILLNSKQIGGTLKAYMLKTSALPQEVKKVKKISTKDW